VVLNYAPWWKRFLNSLLDAIILSVIYKIFSPIMTLLSDYTHDLIILTFAFSYFTFFELILGKTPGKFLTGIKVISPSGRKLTFGQISLRTLIRIIPFEQFSFLFQRGKLGEELWWHDAWSKTCVVNSGNMKNGTPIVSI
jgi:uncharacterized RDD family membrane protein YckC